MQGAGVEFWEQGTEVQERERSEMTRDFPPNWHGYRETGVEIQISSPGLQAGSETPLGDTFSRCCSTTFTQSCCSHQSLRRISSTSEEGWKRCCEMREQTDPTLSFSLKSQEEGATYLPALLLCTWASFPEVVRCTQKRGH
jgi:hypothetical protein